MIHYKICDPDSGLRIINTPINTLDAIIPWLNATFYDWRLWPMYDSALKKNSDTIFEISAMKTEDDDHYSKYRLYPDPNFSTSKSKKT